MPSAPAVRINRRPLPTRSSTRDDSHVDRPYLAALFALSVSHWTASARPSIAARRCARRWPNIHEIAAARAEEAAARAQRRQVDAARWPMVNVLGGLGPSFKATLVPHSPWRSVEQQYRDLSTGRFVGGVPGGSRADPAAVHLRQDCPPPARPPNTACAPDRPRPGWTKADVAMEVARIYEGYLLARDAGALLRRDHPLAGQAPCKQPRTSWPKNAPGTTERDVLRVQTAISLAMMGRNQAQAGQAQAHAGLIAYLGLPRGTTLSFAEDELLPVGQLGLDFERLVALAQQNRPELVALREGRPGAVRPVPGRGRRAGAGPVPAGLPAAGLHARARLAADPLTWSTP